MSVNLSESEMNSYLEKFVSEDRRKGVEVACINSPTNVTISGEEILIDLVQTMLDKDHVFARKLDTGVAYHSSQIRAISSQYLSLIGGLESSSLSRKDIVIISSVTGERVISEDIFSSSEYWVDNMVNPVKFSQAVSQLAPWSNGSLPRKLGTATQATIYDFIEIGPHSTLKRPIFETLNAGSARPAVRYHSALSRFTSSIVSVLKLAGTLHSLGYPIALDEVSKTDLHQLVKPFTLVDLPEYPFNRSRKYWHESRLSKDYKLRKNTRLEFLGTLTVDSNNLEMKWRKFFDARESPWIDDHKVSSLTLCSRGTNKRDRLPAPRSTLQRE